MPSSPRIPRETILKGALEFLIENGYEKLNITALAKKLHCSTQPISWHFGNMEGLRADLAEYALEYAKAKMMPKGKGLSGFAGVGEGFVDIAFDEPNLFRYLYYGDSRYCVGGLENFTAVRNNRQIIDKIAEGLKITSEDAALFLTNTIIYSTGILSLVVSGVMKCDKPTVKKMINKATDAFLVQAGADLSRAKSITKGLTPEK